MDASSHESADDQNIRHPRPTSTSSETEPLLARRPSNLSQASSLPKQLTTRHAFAILITLQIGSGVFASPAQIDSNVPSPGASLLVWALGGLLSWAGAASFAELGAAIPINGGMQEYLRYVYGDTMAFMMAWVYIMATKPSAMAIQSIVIAESIGSIVSFTSSGADTTLLRLVAALALIFIVILNSLNTKFTMRLSESFTGIKITTVFLVVLGGLVAVVAYLVNPKSSLSGSDDWHERNWFDTRPTVSNATPVDWFGMGTWERYGHFATAIYGGLWAFDGWDNANLVASEIRDPGKALPKAIKCAMVVVLSSYELVNVSYYILLPWDIISSDNAVAVTAAARVFGQWAGISITILIALSCCGSITGNVFTIGRLIIAASQRNYLPSFLGTRGIPAFTSRYEGEAQPAITAATEPPANPKSKLRSRIDAPIYANALALIVTLVYVFFGELRALLTFTGMASWIFYVSTVLGLLVLRRREPQLHRPYKPTVLLPIMFVVVGILVIARTAIFAPVQSVLLAFLLVAGAAISKIRSR
ncbi:amino acid transporter [Periconia macrospinosa]|uniref:Amino acid transporter n=1 Tax=Periconia macrospinosa TaxID=97972 RepID=A0A2V1DPI3_9PLEO|nr:amino acid transporter [Periconia macrospinosa]